MITIILVWIWTWTLFDPGQGGVYFMSRVVCDVTLTISNYK